MYQTFEKERCLRLVIIFIINYDHSFLLRSKAQKGYEIGVVTQHSKFCFKI